MDTVYEKLVEQGTIGLLAFICLSGLIYFYHRVEDAVKESKQNQKEAFDLQVKENEKMEMQIAELRAKIDKMYSEDKIALLTVIQRCTETIERNNALMQEVTHAIRKQ